MSDRRMLQKIVPLLTVVVGFIVLIAAGGQRSSAARVLAEAAPDTAVSGIQDGPDGIPPAGVRTIWRSVILDRCGAQCVGQPVGQSAVQLFSPQAPRRVGNDGDVVLSWMPDGPPVIVAGSCNTTATECGAAIDEVCGAHGGTKSQVFTQSSGDCTGVCVDGMAAGCINTSPRR